MPPHADRVRRHYDTVDPLNHPPHVDPGEALTRPMAELDKYSGWLTKDRVSLAVRADVHAVGAALRVGADASVLLLTLDKSIGRLPSGGLRKMLRKALAEVRAIVAPGILATRDGEAL